MVFDDNLYTEHKEELMSNKTVIYSGGTISYVRNHMALCAPAFGATGVTLHQLIPNSQLFLTKMADPLSKLVTNDDIKDHLTEVLQDPEVKCIIMNAALCDYDGQIGDVPSGKHAKRLESREGLQVLHLSPADKVISIIKELRPDVVVAGFKTTCNATDKEIDSKGERMIASGVDFVLANDTGRKVNAIYYGQKAKKYGNTYTPIPNRQKILKIFASHITKLTNEGTT